MSNRPQKCIMYENIIFTCSCSFSTKGIDIIKIHNKYCKGISTIKIDQQIVNLIKEKIIKKFYESLCKSTIEEPKKMIIPIPLPEKIEKNNNKKDITNVFKERHELLSNKTFDQLIKNLEDIYNVFTDYTSQIVTKNIEDKIEDNISYILTNENINIDSLNDKFVENKKLRNQIFIKFTAKNLEKLINNNYSKLVSFLFNFNKKLSKVDKDKLLNIISNSLSGLEGRLLDNFDIKDQGVLFNLGELTEANKNIYFNEIKYVFENKPSSFKTSNFLTQIKNPLLSVLPFQKFIETFILTNYTIIYCEHKDCNYNKNDPYAIYTLSSIDGNIKYWTMDTRAENLAIEIIDSLKNYCINLFTKLWKFNKDNIINEDSIYLEITKTIFLLCDPIKLANKLRIILQSKKKYIPSENDIFNMKCDDLEQKQRFDEYIYEKDALKVAVSEMFSFEDLQKYDIEEFINNIIKV
jgi:hypothetical protein